MNKTATLETLKTDAEYETAIDELFAQMAEMKRDMDARQERIEQKRAATEAILKTLPTAPASQ